MGCIGTKRKKIGRLRITKKKQMSRYRKLKNQWKTFFRTGPIVIAAAIVMIALSIAWFVSNTKVDATGVQISAAGSEFDLCCPPKQIP